jgi:hypothetical protein
MAGALAEGITMIRCLLGHGAEGALLLNITINGTVPSTCYNGRLCSVCAPAIVGYGNGKYHHNHEKGYYFLNIRFFHVSYQNMSSTLVSQSI